MSHKTTLSVVILIMAMSFTSCRTFPDQPPAQKNGKLYGTLEGNLFPYKWWDYYRRALSFAEGGFWKEAEADLKEAIRQRGKDQKRARMFGRSFTDYFPHRELGIVYYHQGRFRDAVRELNESLASVRSPEAESYLTMTKNAIELAGRTPE